MAELKVVLIVNWGAAGWSETYYLDGTLGTKQVTKKVEALIAGRSCLFAATGPAARTKPVIQYYRVAVVGQPNRSKPTAVPPQLQQIDSGITPGDRRNFAYGTAYAGNSHRTLKLKGVPSQWVAGDADERYGSIAPTMDANFKKFAKALVDGGFGMRGKDPAAPALNVTNASISDAGYLVLTIPGLVVVENEMIVLRGMRGSGTKRLNGRLRVLDKLTGEQFVTDKRKCDTCLFKPTNRGKVTKPTFALVEFDDVQFTGWGSGKMGRAFFSDHGRLPACCR